MILVLRKKENRETENRIVLPEAEVSNLLVTDPQNLSQTENQHSKTKEKDRPGEKTRGLANAELQILNIERAVTDPISDPENLHRRTENKEAQEIGHRDHLAVTDQKGDPEDPQQATVNKNHSEIGKRDHLETDRKENHLETGLRDQADKDLRENLMKMVRKGRSRMETTDQPVTDRKENHLETDPEGILKTGHQEVLLETNPGQDLEQKGLVLNQDRKKMMHQAAEKKKKR